MAELDHLRALAIEDRRSERPPIVLDNPPSAPVRRNSSKRLSFNGVARFKSAAKVVQRQLSSIQTFGSPPPVHPYHTTPTSQYTPPPLTAPIEFGEISLTKNATHFPRLPSWHPEAHAVARLSIHSKVASAPSPPPRRRSMAAELPHLVLVNIFLHCRDINPLSPWIVSGVSRRWRIASLAPGLWSRIHLTSALQRPTRTTETWIDRSKNVPYLAVSFNVFESEDNWGRNWSQTIVDDLFQLVWRQLPRIREFEFVTNLQGYTAIAGEWLRGHAPVLQTLRVAYQPRRESPRENMQRQNIPLLIPQTNILQPNIPLALGAPRLLNVTFDAAYIAWSPQLLWGLKRLSLNTCEGHTDIVLLSDILANCPELVSLSLSLPHIHQVAMIPRVTLPRLQEFQVCGTGNVYLALQCIDPPRLKTLIVSDVDGLTLLPSLEGAPRLPLSTLRALVLRNVHNIPSDFMTRLGGFPRLKDLTIDGSSFRSSTRFLDEMGTRRADPSDAMLPKLAVLLFENVPWVDVHDVQRLLQRRASWTRLRRIDVSRCHAFEGPDRKFVAAGPPLQSRLMRASTLPAAPPPPKY